MTHEEACWCDRARDLCATMRQSIDLIEKLISTHEHDIRPLQEMHWRELVVNTEVNVVILSGKTINLTMLEWRILRLFVINRNQWITHGQILDNAWGIDYEGRGDARMIKTHVSHLRSKLAPLSIIETTKGAYRCYLPEPEEASR